MSWEHSKETKMAFAGIGLAKEEVMDMVERYGEAWVSQSTDSLLELFCDDGIYFEKPGKPIQGHDALKTYWQRTVVNKQSNIEFRHVGDEMVFDPENLACCAKWEANFNEAGAGKKKLITVAIIRFRKSEFGTHKIESMEEYSHNMLANPQGGMMGNGMMGTIGNMMGNGMMGNGMMGNGMMGMGGPNPMMMMGQMNMAQRFRAGPYMGAKSDDPVCWDFQKGTCTRGDKCKWQHVK